MSNLGFKPPWNSKQLSIPSVRCSSEPSGLFALVSPSSTLLPCTRALRAAAERKTGCMSSHFHKTKCFLPLYVPLVYHKLQFVFLGNEFFSHLSIFMLISILSILVFAQTMIHKAPKMLHSSHGANGAPRHYSAFLDTTITVKVMHDL